MKRLEARDLTKTYGAQIAVSSISLDLRPGTVTAVIGPNGSGKSTLLGMLAGTVVPDTGYVSVDNSPIDRLAAFRRARVGVRRTFQSARTLAPMSLRALFRIAARRLGGATSMPDMNDQSSFVRLLGALDIETLIDNDVSQFSYGQQRLGVLACMLQDSGGACVLLDEPTSGLSKRVSSKLGSIIRQIATQGAIVLLVEHDMEFVRDTADYVVALQAGTLIASGPTAVVLTSEPVSRAFGIGERACISA